MGSPTRTSGLTYDALLAFPEDHVRRELVDGVLYIWGERAQGRVAELEMSPSPAPRHQEAVGIVFVALAAYARQHGGKAYVAPLDVRLDAGTVLQPDVLYLHAEHIGLAARRPVEGPPDVVVEVRSPSTRPRDIAGKRRVYEAGGVPEYWEFDIDSGSATVWHQSGTGFELAEQLERDHVLTSPQLPGFRLPIADVVGPQDTESGA